MNPSTDKYQLIDRYKTAVAAHHEITAELQAIERRRQECTQRLIQIHQEALHLTHGIAMGDIVKNPRTGTLYKVVGVYLWNSGLDDPFAKTSSAPWLVGHKLRKNGLPAANTTTVYEWEAVQ